MKRLIYLLGILLFSLNSLAQNKASADIITKTSGAKIEAEVKEVTDDQIKFTYTGESVVYTLNRSEVKKIQFKSGRTETFDGNDDDAGKPAARAATADHGNKVAVLPFAYISDGQSGNSEMSIKVQNECYAYLNKHAGNYSIMDVHATNAALAKAGINRSNMDNFSMDDICNALGVAYVVTGMVTVDKGSQTSYQSNAQNSNSKRNEERTKSSSSTYGSSYATADQNYETSMNLSIYNDKGESIFNHNRKAFWHQQDSYKDALEYILKRCPLYKK